VTATLGFYTLDDYKAELDRRGLAVVRCEALTRDSPTKMGDGPGPASRKYFVTLTPQTQPPWTMCLQRRLSVDALCYMIVAFRAHRYLGASPCY